MSADAPEAGGFLSLLGRKRIPHFIFLRGAPGTGKSSVAKRLRRLFCAGVTLEADIVRTFLHSDAKADSSLYRDVIGGLSLMALHFKERGYGPIFIVGHVTDSLLEEWEMAGANGTIRVYTLTASEAVLRSRVRSRIGHGFVDAEFSQVISRRLDPLPKWIEVIIDTSTLDIEGVCRVILNDVENTT